MSDTQHTIAKSWLWPDKVIGKRESRRLRDEHNALANSHDKLLAVCKAIDPNKLEALADWIDCKYAGDPNPEVQADLRSWAKQARAAIAKAKGESQTVPE